MTTPICRRKGIRGFGALLGFVSVLNAGDIEAQVAKQIEVDSRVICKSCRVVVDSLMVLGADDPTSDVSQVRLSSDSRGRIYVVEVSNSSCSTIMVYDSSGRKLQAVGRKGSGPGEYYTILSVTLGTGDTVVVSDVGAGRVTLLDNRYSVVRTFHVPPSSGIGRILGWSGGRGVGLAQKWDTTVDAMRLSLKTFDDRGIITTIFGDALPPGAPPRWYATYRLGMLSEQSLWTAYTNQYRIEQWSMDGRLLSAFNRNVSWFKTWWTAPEVSPKEEVPISSLRGIWQDNAGLLWTVSLVADENWKKKGWKSNDISSTNLGGDIDLVYDTMVEVINPKTGTLVLSQRMPFAVEEISGKGYFTTYWEAPDGSPRRTLRRLRLVQPNTGRSH